MRRLPTGSGFFQHGHTYLAHPVACAAAHAVLSKIIETGLPSRAAMMGDKLIQALQSAFGQHPFIGDIRGTGAVYRHGICRRPSPENAL